MLTQLQGTGWLRTNSRATLGVAIVVFATTAVLAQNGQYESFMAQAKAARQAANLTTNMCDRRNYLKSEAGNLCMAAYVSGQGHACPQPVFEECKAPAAAPASGGVPATGGQSGRPPSVVPDVAGAASSPAHTIDLLAGVIAPRNAVHTDTSGLTEAAADAIRQADRLENEASRADAMARVYDDLASKTDQFSRMNAPMNTLQAGLERGHAEEKRRRATDFREEANQLSLKAQRQAIEDERATARNEARAEAAAAARDSAVQTARAETAPPLSVAPYDPVAAVVDSYAQLRGQSAASTSTAPSGQSDLASAYASMRAGSQGSAIRPTPPDLTGIWAARTQPSHVELRLSRSSLQGWTGQLTVVQDAVVNSYGTVSINSGLAVSYAVRDSGASMTATVSFPESNHMRLTVGAITYELY